MSAKDETSETGESPVPPDAVGGFMLPRPSRTLTALTTSALALPGIAGSARADAPIERATGAFSFSYYNEDDLKNSKFAQGTGGSRSRYEVYTGQLRFDLPVADRVDIGLQFLYEDMSGASPWYTIADQARNNVPVQVMSGATIEDQRFDMLVDADFYMDNGKDTFSTGFSVEKDYASFNFGIGAERNFNDKNTTFNMSGAASFDWIEPTDSDLFVTRPSSKQKWSVDLFAGLSQILTRSTTGQITINYKHSDGYLSDPYKQVATVNVDGSLNSLLSDSRPSGKDQVSIMARLRQHVEPLNASIHLDYRYYSDSFEIVSHTAELAWYQSFFDWLTIAPTIRWYAQSKADFYNEFFPGGTSPGHRSSDFRLSPYGALSGRIKVEVDLRDLAQYDAPAWLQAVGVSEGFDLKLGASWEFYHSDGDLLAPTFNDISETEEAPGLVDFQVFAFSVSGRF